MHATTTSINSYKHHSYKHTCTRASLYAHNAYVNNYIYNYYIYNNLSELDSILSSTIIQPTLMSYSPVTPPPPPISQLPPLPRLPPHPKLPPLPHYPHSHITPTVGLSWGLLSGEHVSSPCQLSPGLSAPTMGGITPKATPHPLSAKSVIIAWLVFIWKDKHVQHLSNIYAASCNC